MITFDVISCFDNTRRVIVLRFFTLELKRIQQFSSNSYILHNLDSHSVIMKSLLLHSIFNRLWTNRTTSSIWSLTLYLRILTLVTTALVSNVVLKSISILIINQSINHTSRIHSSHVTEWFSISNLNPFFCECLYI